MAALKICIICLLCSKLTFLGERKFNISDVLNPTCAVSCKQLLLPVPDKQGLRVLCGTNLLTIDRYFPLKDPGRRQRRQADHYIHVKSLPKHTSRNKSCDGKANWKRSIVCDMCPVLFNWHVDKYKGQQKEEPSQLECSLNMVSIYTGIRT